MAIKRASVLRLTALFLLGWAWVCLPLDSVGEITAVSLAPDGAHLAWMDSTEGFFLYSISRMEYVVRGDRRARGDRFSWRPDGLSLALPMDRGRGWDIWELGIDGRFVRWTQHLARDAAPVWSGNGQDLLFVSWREGTADIYRKTSPRGRSLLVVGGPFEQWEPRVGRDGQGVLFYTMQAGQPEAWLAEPMREPRFVGSVDPGNSFRFASVLGWERSGNLAFFGRQNQDYTILQLSDLGLGSGVPLLQRPVITDCAMDLEEGWLLLGTGDFTYHFPLSVPRPEGLGRQEVLRAHNLPVNRIALSRPGVLPGLAGVVAEDTLALGSLPEREFSYIHPDFASYLTHASALRDAERFAEAQALLFSLAEQGLERPEQARLLQHHALLLRREGRFTESQDMLERAQEIEGTGLARELRLEIADLLFFEKKDFAGARARYQRLLREGEDELLEERLAVLDSEKPDWIRLYSEAHSRLRQGDADGALAVAREMARRYDDLRWNVVALLGLLSNPYAEEGVRAKPNPFDAPVYREKVAASLLLLHGPLPGRLPAALGPLQDRLTEELVFALMGAHQFEQAQDYAAAMIQRSGVEALGLEDFLEFYIEADRTARREYDLLNRLLLTRRMIRLIMPQLTGDSEAQARLALARIKMELLEGNLDIVRDLLVETTDLFHRVPREAFTPEVASLQTYLYLYAAKRHERLGNWSSAAQNYATALQLLEKYMPSNLRLYFLIGAAHAEAEAAHKRADAIHRMQIVLRGMGDPLLNPTIEPGQLRIGARNLNQILISPETSDIEAFLLYHLGCTLARAERPHAACHMLDRALLCQPPPALRRAILWEKSVLYEITENHYLQWQTCLHLADLTDSPELADMLHIQAITPMLKLGRRTEARQALTERIRQVRTRPVLEAARQQLEILEVF